MDPEVLKSKFVGAMLGTFVGDTLGMPYEGLPFLRPRTQAKAQMDLRAAPAWVRGTAAIYGLALNPRGGVSHFPLGRGTYTDDTEMMIGVAESLVARGGFDGEDMARRFAENFDPRRGYGPGSIRVLQALRSGVELQESAKRAFGEVGSFGNGGAMRVAPVGLLYWDKPVLLRQIAEASATITHVHKAGKEGAVLQAAAIAAAVKRLPNMLTSADDFIQEVQQSIESLSPEFSARLAAITTLLHRRPKKKEVVDQLGNDVTAVGSVPTAIFAFLHNQHSFAEAVTYAVSLGGDTDTIGAMTGAIAGAFHGMSAIPSRWIELLENGAKGREYVGKLAARLLELHSRDRY